MMIYLNKNGDPEPNPERRRKRVRISDNGRTIRYRLVDDSPMSPIQQDATDLFEEKSTARVEKEIPIQFVYEEDESSKSSLHPPLFSVRHGSARKSIRSQSEDQMLNMSIKSLFVAFCHRTSSHGIPFMGMSTFFGKTIWICAFSCALLSFLIQTYWTFSAYFQYRTIIEMQLKFKAAPFPAATVCNLNPFKYSELVMFEEIREGFEIWEQVINAREMNDRIKYGESGNLFGAGEEDTLDLRRKREMEVMENAENEGADYQPVFVRCTCLNAEQCVPNRNPLEVNASVCMCFEDVTKGNIWPCYPTSAWTVKSEIKWWNPQNWNISRVTEPPPIVTYDENEAYGLRDKYDAGSITVQTKENLIFMVAALPREIKRNLSYSLKEFVKRCSFNAKDCNMTEDFKLHLDPEYGNCYTFNFNDSVTKTNSRAGPVYGLRLLLDVHQDDYMPTTEAAGVRLVIHEQDQEPFPDTFGYSAPTGFISSFGLKTKVLKRLEHPYSDCDDAFRPEVYIYDEHYSPEGCHRNCFQRRVLQNCTCGDPRYPLPHDDTDRYCGAKVESERKCLDKMIAESGGHHKLSDECICKQPCHENVFETSYSAAAWPAKNVKIGSECPADESTFNDSVKCLEYYRENTAYIEIYYEQLNFETLNETAGYSMVNLFSDLGGNIGLWIGFSAITMLEIFEFLIEAGQLFKTNNNFTIQMIYYLAYVKPYRIRRYKMDIKRRLEGANQLNSPQILDRHKNGDKARLKRRDSDDQLAQVEDEESEANLLKPK